MWDLKIVAGRILARKSIEPDAKVWAFVTQYYRDNVIGGTGAFVVPIDDFNSFGRAMVRKLVNEIAGRGRPATLASARSGPRRDRRAAGPTTAAAAVGMFPRRSEKAAKGHRRKRRQHASGSPGKGTLSSCLSEGAFLSTSGIIAALGAGHSVSRDARCSTRGKNVRIRSAA